MVLLELWSSTGKIKFYHLGLFKTSINMFTLYFPLLSKEKIEEQVPLLSIFFFHKTYFQPILTYWKYNLAFDQFHHINIEHSL